MVGESKTITSVKPSSEMAMYSDAGAISAGIHPIYNTKYERRITMYGSRYTGRDSMTMWVEFKKYHDDIEFPSIPEPIKPWKERRHNNYKAKRRK